MPAETNPIAKSFVRATTMLAGGTAAGQLIVVAISPIVSRLYPDANSWGTLATFANILSCIAPIVCLRYEAAISLPKEEEKADHLLTACLLSTALLSALTLGFVILAGPWLGSVFQNKELPTYLWFLPLSVLALGIYTSFSYWAIRRRDFKQVAKTRVAQGFTQAACQLGFGFFRLGTAGLVLGDVLGRVAGGGTIAFGAGLGRLRAKLSDVRATAREYSSFPRVSGPATLLHNFTTTFTLLLGPMYGSPALGLYFFGIRNLWAPVSLIAQAMAQVYLGEASKWARDDPALMLRSFDQIVNKLALLGLVPFAILAVAGGPITAFVFGAGLPETALRDRYNAGVLVQIQAVSWWAMFVVGPVLNTLNILQKQSWQLWCDAAGLALMGVAFWCSYRFGWSIFVAVALYSVAMTILYFALYICCRRAIVLTVNSSQ